MKNMPAPKPYVASLKPSCGSICSFAIAMFSRSTTATM